MRINFDRLSKLAGLPESNTSRRSLNEHNEGKKRDHPHKDVEEMADIAYMDEMADAEAADEMADPMEEMVEVDEAMLVQELRRAKRIMQENRRRKQLSESKRQQRKQRMFEAQLRSIIDEEVQNVFDEMNYNSGWVYGNNKPKRSRNGYTHQGSFMPGLGFKR